VDRGAKERSRWLCQYEQRGKDAEELRFTANVLSRAVVTAFATVPLERFVGTRTAAHPEPYAFGRRLDNGRCRPAPPLSRRANCARRGLIQKLQDNMGEDRFAERCRVEHGFASTKSWLCVCRTPQLANLGARAVANDRYHRARQERFDHQVGQVSIPE
jgi:hypothetical protein